MFNINTFKGNISDFGYLKTNLFEVYINAPKIMQNKSINNNGKNITVQKLLESQRFRIDQVRAPGISLASADVNRWSVGPTQKQPFNAQYNEISFSILCDSKGAIWQFWYNWMNSIFEFNPLEDTNLNRINSLPSYSAEYKSNYSTMMQLLVYDQTGSAIQKFNLIEAFPTALREVPLAWGDNGNMIKINVSISYTYYTMVATNVTETFIAR